MKHQFVMSPQLQLNFNAIDRDHSGKISINEIVKAYAHMKFPRRSAKMLLQAVSDLPFIDANTFPLPRLRELVLVGLRAGERAEALD